MKEQKNKREKKFVLVRYKQGLSSSKAGNFMGFTLIEFLIYSVIVTLIVGALVLTGVNIMQARARISVIEEVNHNGKMIMTTITRHIRCADDFNIISNPLALKLSMSAQDVEFTLSGGSLVIGREGEVGTSEINSETVTVSNFSVADVSYPDTFGTIKIGLTVEYNNPTGREEYDFSRTFYTTENIRR